MERSEYEKYPENLSFERRYSDKELGLILKLAAERQNSIDDSNNEGLSLAEIRQIAVTAGIDPKFIMEAAAALEAQAEPRGGSFIGAPTKFRFERTVTGEVSESEFSEIIDVIRRATGRQGQVSHMPNSLEWKSQDHWDRHTFITISRRRGEMKIQVFGHWWGPAVLLYVGTGIAGLLATLGVGFLIHPASAAGVGALIAGGAGSTYLTARALWQRMSRKTENTLRKWLGQVEDVVAATATSGGSAPEEKEPQWLSSQTERE